MYVDHKKHPSSFASFPALSVPDPMAKDAEGGELIVLTRQRLARVALVASEVGARFQRDGLHHDPMAWMLAPRRLFGGLAPLDAALELENCERAIVLHGLGLLDEDPGFIDEFRHDDGENGDECAADDIVELLGGIHA